MAHHARSGGIGLAGGRSVQIPLSYAVCSYCSEPNFSGHVGLGVDHLKTVNHMEQPMSARTALGQRPSRSDTNAEQAPLTRTSTLVRPSQLPNSVEQPTCYSYSIS
ncbi:hypothetical protein SDJN02_17858 [Cucurbita argyrosperma subsp. argyrosperma]|nr:hypothetical protein SDJN02_17858 [Cucurbita argyrosperma subsp. argyrosperma]